MHRRVLQVTINLKYINTYVHKTQYYCKMIFLDVNKLTLGQKNLHKSEKKTNS
jgi:hypothetical protein